MSYQKNVKRLIASFIELLCRSKKTVLLILTVVAITIILDTTISIWLSRVNHLYFPSIGNIRTLGVEAYGGDIETIAEKQYIDWGTIYLGALTNRSFYLRSKSNIETTLNLETVNWTFLDSYGKNVSGANNGYLSLGWNYTNTPINPREEVYITFTLNASASETFINFLVTNEVTNFSFDMCIYASKD